jgi:NitT/TauT family transport system permease protein
LYGSLSILLFLALWQIAVVSGAVTEAVVPKPTTVLVTLWKSLASGQILGQMRISLINILIGFVISVIISIPVGLLIGAFYHSLEKILIPFMRMCEKLNPFALFPVFMIFFGIGSIEKIAVVFWVSQWPLVFNTIDGIRNMDHTMIKSARSMGANRVTMLFKVILPSSVPSIFTGLKMGAQLAFFMIIASELIGSSSGLGWLYLTSNNAYNVPMMYAIIIFITILAILINVLFTRLERHFLVWKQSAFETN